MPTSRSAMPKPPSETWSESTEATVLKAIRGIAKTTTSATMSAIQRTSMVFCASSRT